MTEENLRDAAQTLGATERGRQSMEALLRFLDEGGIGLDLKNQSAFRTLLDGAWGEFAGTARDAMRDELNREIRP